MQSSSQRSAPVEAWPALPLAEWSDTCDTLHLWTQMVGKVKLALCPFQNHWWHVALTVSERGLTTGNVPFAAGVFSIDFDFLSDLLLFRTSAGAVESIPLAPRTVASFYAEFRTALANLGIHALIRPTPAEMVDAIPFDQDEVHRSYDSEAVRRWWRIQLSVDQVFRRHNTTFTGKSSPVLFFWGSFDLALARFSGRLAPFLDGVPRFMALAEDRENVTCGFWPGNRSASGMTLGEPAFFSYIYPEPDGFREARIGSEAASFRPELGLFILPYEAVRTADSPEQTLLQFLRGSYEAAATLAGWDRQTLEIDYPETGAR